MKYLSIYNGDGDVFLNVHDEYPVSEFDGYKIEGLKFLSEHNDSNYWPDQTVVVVRLAELAHQRAVYRSTLFVDFDPDEESSEQALATYLADHKPDYELVDIEEAN